MEDKSINALEILSKEYPDYVFIGKDYLDEESTSYSIGRDNDLNQSNSIRIRSFISALEILKQELIVFLNEGEEL